MKTKIYTKIIKSPLGDMFACANDEGICILEFADKQGLGKELKSVLRYFDAEISTDESPFFSLLEKELKAYFSGKLKQFSVPLSLVGTEFQKSVWEVLLKIPYGQTWSYSRQAETLGDKKKVRAVANANGANKIPIIIPCHRVIGSNGKLTGYSSGIWRKQKLLELEGICLV